MIVDKLLLLIVMFLVVKFFNRKLELFKSNLAFDLQVANKEFDILCDFWSKFQAHLDVVTEIIKDLEFLKINYEPHHDENRMQEVWIKLQRFNEFKLNKEAEKFHDGMKRKTEELRFWLSDKHKSAVDKSLELINELNSMIQVYDLDYEGMEEYGPENPAPLRDLKKLITQKEKIALSLNELKQSFYR